MTIEVTHNLGDIVFFLQNDKIASGNIYKIEATIDDEGQTAFLFLKTENYGSAVLRPHQVFYSRQQLIDQL
jgi:hypothetical protein